MIARFITTIVILLGLGLLVWKWDVVGQMYFAESATVDKPVKAETPDVRVITTPVLLTANDRVFEAMGSGRAKQSVQLYPAVAEEVMAVYFKSGDKVKAGQLLVQLDDREEKLAVQLAEVRLKDAQSLLNRYQLAVKDGAVPQSEVDSARAAVDIAKVNLDRAKLEVSYRQILAPFDGVVGISRIDPGERVDTNTLITGIDDRTILHVDFDVPEVLAVELTKDNTITAQTPAFPNQTFSGTIEALESRIDPKKRTIMTRASIVNDDDTLRPGMSFMTRLEIAGKTYPTVPEISLQWGRDGSFVWVIRDSHAERIPVRVIARTTGDVLIEGDIDETDQVVVEGVQRMQPGRKVIVSGTFHPPGREPKESGS